MTEDDLEGVLVDRRYRVGRRIAVGGFGVVYAAEHIGLGAPVALKILRSDPSADPARSSARIAQFLNEARMLQRLRHPHIVAMQSAGFVPGRASETPYIALAWCGEHTLADMLRDERGGAPRTPEEAWRLLAPVVDAIAYAHAQGVLHTDLTPSNVMVDRRDEERVLRVIDFGFARLAPEPETDTQAAPVAFTRAYAAPEQASGRAPLPATDVHALALLFLEVLCKRHPYGDEPGLAAIDPCRPSAEALGATAGCFTNVLSRALALDPADRFDDAGALALALQQAADSLSSSTADGVAVVTVPEPRTRAARHFTRRRLVVGALVAAPALVAGGLAVNRWREPVSPIGALDVRAITERLEQAGYTALFKAGTVDSKTAMISARVPAPLSVSNESLAILRIGQLGPCGDASPRDCGRRVRDALLRMYHAENGSRPSVFYASDGTTTLWVEGSDPATTGQVRDLAVAGLPHLMRGSLGADERPSDEDAVGDTLATFGPGELETCLRRAGFDVRFATEGKEGVAVLASYLSGSDVGNATLYRGNVQEIVRSIELQPEPFAWAQAGDHVLILRGPGATATRETLARLIDGTDARIGGARP